MRRAASCRLASVQLDRRDRPARRQSPGCWARRPQVVRDGVDQRGLEGLALAGNLKIHGRVLELVAPQRDRELVGGKGEDARRLATRLAGGAIADGHQGAQVRAIELDADAVLGRAAGAGGTRARAMGAHPAGRLVAPACGPGPC